MTKTFIAEDFQKWGEVWQYLHSHAEELGLETSLKKYKFVYELGFLTNKRITEGLSYRPELEVVEFLTSLGDFTKETADDCIGEQYPILYHNVHGLYNACNFEAVKLLIKKGYNTDIPFHPECFFSPPWSEGIEGIVKERKELLKLLVKNGSDLNHLDKYTRPFLCYAIKHKDYELVDWLLKNGAESVVTELYYGNPRVIANLTNWKLGDRINYK